jgi:hypothetical protein
VKLLDHLGLVDIEPGPRLINIFRLSNRWRCIDEVEAVRLAELAREVMPQRRFERRENIAQQWGEAGSYNGDVGASVPPQRDGVHNGAVNSSNVPVKPKPIAVTRPRLMPRRVPSLPTMPWQDDGR